MRKWRDGDFIPICFVESSYFIHVIRIYLHILVSNTISMSDDIRVVKQITRRVSYMDQELLTLFSGIHVARSLVFCIMLCRSLFVILAIAWSALRFPTSDYPFRILNFLFLQTWHICDHLWHTCIYWVTNDSNKTFYIDNIFYSAVLSWLVLFLHEKYKLIKWAAF